MNIKNELMALVGSFDTAGISYALCGGLAMAAHGWPRSTMDVDVLIEEPRLDDVRTVARSLGFTHEPGLVPLQHGAITMVRMVKFMGQDFLPLDLILVGPELEKVWALREKISTADGDIWVVAREGLIAMKQLRNSGLDKDDIEKLRRGNHDDR